MFDLIRRTFRPIRRSQNPIVPLLSTDAERREIERRKEDVLARLELLRIETELPALRRMRNDE